MNSVNNKILVRCDLQQKEQMQIGDVVLKTATAFDTNYRERSPVVAEALETKFHIGCGDILLCHHNLFYSPSPYFLKSDTFAIPYSTASIFAVIDKEGNPKAICGNILAEEIYEVSLLDLPPDQRKKRKDMVRIASDGYGYRKGQIVFTRPSAPYIIVYNWNNIERRIVKINSEMILGYLK